MRLSTQYLVAGAAVALIGGLALASTRLPSGPQPALYCSSVIGTPPFAACPDSPMMQGVPVVVFGDSPAPSQPDPFIAMLDGGLELHSGKPEKAWPTTEGDS